MPHNAVLAVFGAPPTPHGAVLEDGLDAGPPTKRFNAVDLAVALAALDAAEAVEESTFGNDDGPATLTVSAEDTRALIEKAFHSSAAHGPKTDDEPTVDLPPPAIPSSIPSPLGDDDVYPLHDDDLEPIVASEAPRWLPDDVLEPDLDDFALDLQRARSSNVHAPDSGPAFGGLHHDSAPASVRANRARPEPVHAVERGTRSTVIAIWSIAVAMAAIFTYVLVTAESSSPYPQDGRAAAER